MSTSIKKFMCLYLDLEKLYKYTSNSEVEDFQKKLDDILLNRVPSLNLDEDIKKALEKNSYNLPEWEINNALLSWDKKLQDSENSHYLQMIYHFDKDKGIGICLPEDYQNFRFNYDIDSFEATINSNEPDFICKKIYGNYLNGEVGMIYEGSKPQSEQSFTKPNFYNLDEMQKIYINHYQDNPQDLSMTEFYQKMEDIGFTPYTNWLYFVILQALDILDKDINLIELRKELNVHVITSWS